MSTIAPLYDLTRIHEAARNGRISLVRGAQIGYQELDYALEDVHDCLAHLTSQDFAGRFERNGVTFDVYHPRYAGPQGHIDELYVKLSEQSRATLPQVLLASFHLKRHN